MQRNEIEALFLLAGINTLGVKQIENEYWPKHPDYDNVRESNPWWRVVTDFGLIVVGRRKKVIQIDWREGNRRGIVTEDDVTKDDTHVHAWSLGKAVSYLQAIKTLPVVDVPLSEFVYYGCTKFKDIDIFIRRFSDTATVEHKIMLHILDTVDPETIPIRLSATISRSSNDKARYVLHVGDLRIEWMTKRG